VRCRGPPTLTAESLASEYAEAPLRITYGVRGIWINGRWHPLIAGASDDGDDSGSGDESSKSGDESDPKNDGEQHSGDKSDDDAKKRDGDLAKALDAERAERRKAQKKIDDYERKEREATEAAAKQKGEYEKLYNELKDTHDREISELKAELFRRDAERALLSYLGEKHPSHVARVRWLWPVLSAELKSDMDTETVNATVKRVADEYVKDHPSEARNGGAPGNGGNGGGNQPPRDALAKFGTLKDFMDTAMPVPGAGGK
jgi:hypothetical protein